MRGLYVHVPLCVSKCVYCDFYSLPTSVDRAEVFLQSLLLEIRLKGRIWGEPVDTVYFGGGTPSCLSVEQAAAILRECGRFFSWGEETETTFEINPGTVHADYLLELRRLGVNRVSMGLQAAQNHHLRSLGRAHDVIDFARAVDDVKKAGFTNFSIDAIYGLPGQRLTEYLETLACIVATGAKHVSVYALQVEPGTPLAQQVTEGRMSVPDDDAAAEMMLAGRDFLVRRGYVHYEISNFALPGFHSRHNTLYWRNEEYVGLGPGATSYLAGRRFANIADLTSYTEQLQAGRLPVAVCERATTAQAMAETMILGLRMLEEGVNRPQFFARFGRDPVHVYAESIGKLVELGLIEVSENAVRLTTRGFPIASQVQMSFLP